MSSWHLILGSFSKGNLEKEEVDEVERRSQEATRWKDQVEEQMGLVKVAYQNYKILIEEKKMGKEGETGASKRYDTQDA